MSEERSFRAQLLLKFPKYKKSTSICTLPFASYDQRKYLWEIEIYHDDTGFFPFRDDTDGRFHC